MKKYRTQSVILLFMFVFTTFVGAVIVTGCQDAIKKIPIFNPKASLLNKVASAEELEVEVNNELARLRDEGILTQAEIDKNFTPKLDKAEAIIKATRAVARSTTKPTTVPAGSLDEAKLLLISVREILKTIDPKE